MIISVIQQNKTKEIPIFAVITEILRTRADY